MIKYIKESQDRALMANQSATMHGLFGTPIVIKDNITNAVRLTDVIKIVNHTLPDYYRKVFEQNLDVIYVGNFPILRKRSIGAMFVDGAILVSNVQDDPADMAHDIIHELAHVVFEVFSAEIGENSSFRDEYEQKLTNFYFRINDKLPNFGTGLGSLIFVPEKEAVLDAYLHDVIGYDIVFRFSHDLVINPYSLVSLREYFATGFEEFYAGEQEILKHLCPVLTEFINYLDRTLEGGEYVNA